MVNNCFRTQRYRYYNNILIYCIKKVYNSILSVGNLPLRHDTINFTVVPVSFNVPTLNSSFKYIVWLLYKYYFTVGKSLYSIN